MSARALVLDGHCDAAIATVQSLGRLGVRVDVASKERRSLACRSRYARRVVEQPDVVPSELARWLDGLAYSEPTPTLVVPSTEASLIAMRRLPASHPLRLCAPLPPDASLDIALDKLACAGAALAAGMAVPRTRVVRPCSRDPEWDYPTVLKPTRSKLVVQGKLVTAEAVIAQDPQQRERYLRRWCPTASVIEQECVPGAGFAVSVLCERGSVRWHFAHHRLHELPLHGGPSTYRQAITAPPAILAACTRLMRHLDWHGVAMVEFKGDMGNSTPRFLEVNPRLWGSLGLAVRAGVDFPRGLLDLAEGRPVGPQPTYAVGLRARNLPRDALRLRSAIASGVGPSLSGASGRDRRPASARRLEVWDHVAADDLRTSARVVGRAVANLALGQRGR